jgi:hypothetical protein
MFPPVDTKNPAAVFTLVGQTFHRLFPDAALTFLDRAFADITLLYTGRHPDYRALDLHYHNFEHTLQATVCLTLLLEGAQQSGEIEKLSPRQFELAIAAALLHDSGYLKARNDEGGTGAKYTLTHVLRSCAFAASYLPTLGVGKKEISSVLNAINCTGPSNEISRLKFDTPTARFLGCALGTADLLGQMAATDYPEKLVPLYSEFLESDKFVDVPQAKRRFKSSADLISKTPHFWSKITRPKLDADFRSVYRFLARPYPGGPNLYLEHVEHNIEVVRRRNAAAAGQPA